MTESDDGRFWGLVKVLRAVHDERTRLEGVAVKVEVVIEKIEKKKKKRKKRKKVDG